jgi:hypothetical protein
VSQALDRGRRPLLAAEAEELDLPPGGLSHSEKVAIVRLFRSGHRVSHLIELYGLDSPQQFAEIVSNTRLPHTAADRTPR